MPNWGIDDVTGFSNAGFSDFRSMGGTSPNLDNMVLDSISFYAGGGTGHYVRLALYAGGALDDPSTAELVEDLGATEVIAGQFYTINSSTNPAIPKNTPIWIAFKSDDNIDIKYTTDSAESGDFQSARGRNDTSLSSDPATAFPDPYGQTGSFSSAWYGCYLTYSISGSSSSSSSSASSSSSSSSASSSSSSSSSLSSSSSYSSSSSSSSSRSSSSSSSRSSSSSSSSLSSSSSSSSSRSSSSSSSSLSSSSSSYSSSSSSSRSSSSSSSKSSSSSSSSRSSSSSSSRSSSSSSYSSSSSSSSAYPSWTDRTEESGSWTDRSEVSLYEDS